MSTKFNQFVASLTKLLAGKGRLWYSTVALKLKRVTYPISNTYGQKDPGGSLGLFVLIRRYWREALIVFLVIWIFLLSIFRPAGASTVPENGPAIPTTAHVSAKKPLSTPNLQSQSQVSAIYVPLPPTSVSPTVGCGSDPNMAYIYQHESGCRTNASNPYTGAYGLCQALPGYKMASVGADWQTNWVTQNAWCIGYADSRYGSPYLAMLAWEAQGWW